MNCTPTITARKKLHNMITFHHANTWLKSWKAQDCTSLCPKTIVIHVSYLIPCRIWHCSQAQVLSHLPHLSFRQSHQHTQDLRYTILIYPAMIHGRVADQQQSRLSQGVLVFSAFPSVLTSSSTTPTPLTGIRRNPCPTPFWAGMSGHLADPTPNTRWTHRKSILKESMQMKYWRHKRRNMF